MLLNRSSKRARQPARRRGAAAVEFAVCSFLLAVLVVGIQEIGQAIRIKEILTDSARAAARVGALPKTSTSTCQTYATGVLADIFGTSGTAASSSNVTVLLIPGPGPGNPWTSSPSISNGTNADISTAQRGDAICVKVSVPMSETMWVYGWFFTGTTLESEYVIMLRQG
jgi:Flp pilus assembly protein TadG